jgi:inorganic pyrophosphatase
MEDGEELDALVAVTEPTFPGCLVRAKPIALLRMWDGDRPNHKVLTVPLSDPSWEGLDNVDDLPGDLADEIIHFFSVYTDIEGKEWQIEGWSSREEALEQVEEARERHRANGS